MLKSLLNPLTQGTFNAYTGLGDVNQCTSCTPGQYCEIQALNETSGPCDSGYYCPGGQNSSRPSEYPCTVSHYCPVNSSAPVPCSNGTFMNHTMGAECYICIEGWYVII